MNAIKSMVMLCLAVSFQTATARAAEPEAKAGAGEDAAILPFIIDGTFFVARLDVDRVDQDALGKYLRQAIEEMFKNLPIPEDQKAESRKEAFDGIESTKRWLTDMSAAGGKRLYVVMDWANEGGRDRGNALFVAPLGEGADAEKIKGTFLREGAFASAKTAEIGNAVVLGDPGAIERATARLAPGAKPATRPDLAAAFAAAGDAPLRIALVPGEPTRAWLEANLPNLPEQIGGGDTKVLSRGVRYATIAVAQKPTTAANFTIRCEDAAQARALHDVITKATAFAKQSVAGHPQGDEAAKEIDSVRPKVQGDTVTMSVDPALLLRRAAVRVEHDVDTPPNPNQKAQPAERPKKDDGGL